MNTCPVCSAELTGSGIRCPSCGASLTVAQPTIKQPPAASGGQRKSSNSATTTSSGQGSFISGTVLDGRYRIVALLGRGGMGEVYKAEDLKLDHEVALKFLPESFAKDEAGLTRFRTEVRIARQVTHQNVCRVFDIGEFEGRHFLTMEYIDGEDLSSLLRRIGRLPADKALEVSRQICAGLAAAHGAGVPTDYYSAEPVTQEIAISVRVKRLSAQSTTKCRELFVKPAGRAARCTSKKGVIIVTMRTSKPVLLAALTALMSVSVVRAQEMHRHDSSAELGRVNFPVSCTAAAQKQFNRAVAWLHSFEYEEAEKAFTEVTVTDPRCGMGYWGIAMSGYHPIWMPPSAEELQKGSSAIEKAKSVGARTQRERDYIAAIEVFYRDSDKLDHKARTFAYSNAMEQLYQRHPSDREAGVFYALTLIATGMMANEKTYTNEKKAAQILNRVLAVEPQHPGVTHYLIHSYDYPALARLALPAARSYAKIAPASAHARHMPSHIFTRLGLWQEAIRSNLDAKAAAKAFAVRNRMSGVWDEHFHAMDYLAYAYLQGAQDKQAWGVLDELNKIQRAEPESFKVAYAFTAIPARYALERRRWDEAAKLTLPPRALGAFPWHRFHWAEAHIHFARAIGAARNGDTASARQEVEKLAAIRQALVEIKGDYDWARQVDIQRKAASAWLAHAEGKDDEALQLMRAAAELDDATDKHPVTPGAILPAREMLGDLLSELNQSALALKEYETALESSPNRFNSIYGVARSAELSGDYKKARAYYERLAALCNQSDGSRPELQQAKTYLAKR